MPFSSTASLTSTDMNNTLRGLYRDNSDHAVTGTTNETDLASVSITGGTIGATGNLIVETCGSKAGGANNRTIRIYLGSTVLVSLVNNVVEDWFFRLKLSNTASNAQRVDYIVTNATTFAFDYITFAVDTSQNQTLKVTGQLTNAADTITQSKFEVWVQQIT